MRVRTVLVLTAAMALTWATVGPVAAADPPTEPEFPHSQPDIAPMRGCSTVAPTPTAPPGTGHAVQVIYAWHSGIGNRYHENVEKIARVVDRIDWSLDQASDYDQHFKLSCRHTPNGSYADYARALVVPHEIPSGAGAIPSATVRSTLFNDGYDDDDRLYLVFTDFDSASDASCNPMCSAIAEVWDSGVAGHELVHLLGVHHAWAGEGGSHVCADIMGPKSTPDPPDGCGWEDWWAMDHDYNSYYDPSEPSTAFVTSPPAAGLQMVNIATSSFLTPLVCCDVGASNDLLTSDERTVESGTIGGAAPPEFAGINATLRTTDVCWLSPPDKSCHFYDGRKSLEVSSGLVGPGPTPGAPFGFRLATRPTVSPRRTYTFSVALRTNAAAAMVLLVMDWFDAAGGAITASTSPVAVMPDWQKASVTAKAPADAASVDLRVISLVPESHHFFADALQLSYAQADGHQDLIDFETTGGAGNWVKLRNKGDGTFEWAGNAVTGISRPRQALRLDYDGDGHPDMLHFEATSTGAGSWLKIRNLGDGTFLPTGPPAISGVGMPEHALTVDYNLDGYVDVLGFEATGTTTGSWTKLRNNGDGTFAYEGAAVTGMTIPDHAVALNYDDDEHMDILQFEVDGGSWVKLENQGDNTFSHDGYAVTGMTNPDQVVTLDYDADGDTDLLAFERPDSSTAGWVKLRNNGDGTLTHDGYAVAGLTTPSKAVLVDYDRDGDLDLLDFEAPTGSWAKLRNHGGGTFSFDGFAVTGMTTPDAVVAMDWGG